MADIPITYIRDPAVSLGGSGQSGAGSPVGSSTPDFVDQLYRNTDDDGYWRSTGLTNADWVEIGGTAQGISWSPGQDTFKGVTFEQFFPDDATVFNLDGVVTVEGELSASLGTSTATFNAPDLVQVTGSVLLQQD